MNNHIIIRIPASTLISSIKALADDIGCDVRYCADGSFQFVERKPVEQQEKVSS